MRKTGILTAFLVVAGISAFGQSEISRTSEWKLFYEDEKVKFYAHYADCNVPSEGLYAEYVLLRAVNKTSETVALSWYNDTWYDWKCTSCDHDVRDRKRTITLSAGEEREGDCKPGLNVGLKVFSKFLQMPGKETLSQLKVTDISTNYIK